MSFLRTVEYNLRRREQCARESLGERFQRRSARYYGDRLRRARAHIEQQMANKVNFQIETNVSEQDCGFQTVADDGIIDIVIDDSCVDEEELNDNDHAGKGPSTEEDFNCQLMWLEQQEECQAVCNTCARVSDKNTSLGLNQKKILDFFS
ncbi:hypothetical protein AVEN_95974-1 [Araneus ventricosus]|uniref:Uncharacterized protein n=1 Tax=Araneus ventricosus TaxID=182803 RepID=A0A4Y2B310_ARAVE|nr:hypothetical protein AVEN_95974-1 [Araneus ventricosus]